MFDKTAKLEKAYRRYPRVPLFARLADACLRRGKAGRALALCEEGCGRFPDYPTGLFVLSRCYEAEGRLEEAREALDRGLRLDPRCPAPYRQLSRLYDRMGNDTLARKCLEAAAQLDPFSESLAQALAARPAGAAAHPGPGEQEPAFQDEATGPDVAHVQKTEPPPATGTPSTAPDAEADGGEPFARLEPQPEWDQAMPAAPAEITLEPSPKPEPSPEPEPSPGAESSPEPADGDSSGQTAALPDQDEVAALGLELTELFGEGEDSAPTDAAPPTGPEATGGAAEEDPAPAVSVEEGEPDGMNAAGPAEPVGEARLAADEAMAMDPAASAAAASIPPSRVEESEPAAAAPSEAGPDEMEAPPELGVPFELAEPKVEAVPEVRPRGTAVARFGNGTEELEALLGDLAGGPVAAIADPAGEPVSPVPTPTLARLYAEQGFTDRAASVYRQVLAMRPDDEEARSALASLQGG